MNGYCEINIAGKSYPLKFGMVAVEDIAGRMASNPSVHATKILIDLIYGGMMNHSIANSLPVKPYDVVYNLCEDLADEPDYQDQTKLVWETFQSSKHGSKWTKALEDLGKKKKEVESQ